MKRIKEIRERREKQFYLNRYYSFKKLQYHDHLPKKQKQNKTKTKAKTKTKTTTNL